MVGTASPVMKKKTYIKHPLTWVIKNKIRVLIKKPVCIDKQYYNVGQDPTRLPLAEAVNDELTNDMNLPQDLIDFAIAMK